jgi:hypothetical protein
MYYAVLLIFIALLAFFMMPTNNNAPKQKKEDKLDTQNVQYTPPKRDPPQRTQGTSTRVSSDKDKTSH